MGDKNKLYDDIITAGNIILKSEPFANPSKFFEPVIKARELDVPGFANEQHNVQYDLLNAWGKGLKNEISLINGKLSWETHVSSYPFLGTAYRKGIAGKIIGDFPIALNIKDVEGTSLYEAAKAAVDFDYGDYSARAVFRQQYGESFVDHMSVSEKYPANASNIFEEIKDLPIQLVSAVDPLVHLKKDKKKWQKLDFIGDWSDKSDYFYFKPQSLRFSNFYFGIDSEFKERMITEYLDDVLRDVRQDLYGINPLFTDFIGLNHEKSSEQAKKIYSRLQGIVRKSFFQRNIETAKVLSDSADFSYYATGRIGNIRNTSFFDHHYPTDKLIEMRSDKFPRTYVLHFESEENENSIIRIKETNGDYCVWLKNRQGLDKVVNHLAKF